jgi:fucose 4-O-acetylase-like acetyltransferase
VKPSPAGTNFTLFPWAGFVFAGAVVGESISVLGSADRAPRIQGALAAASVLVIGTAYEASLLPSIYPVSEFWTSSPTFFFLRVGAISLLLPLAFLWERSPWRGLVSQWSPVEELGRASLFVYWIHVEMVYGFLSRPLRANLSFPAATAADILFSAFILGLLLLKNRLMTMRKVAALSAAGATPASI